jgi:diguanylate cyclase (GGDEF)-like protein
LTQAFAGPGLVGRLGGDEFIIILTHAADSAQLDAMTTGWLAALCVPARIGALNLPLAASIGYALRRDASESPTAVMKRADEALYAAKGLQASAPRALLPLKSA